MQDKASSCSNVENRLENASRDWPSQTQPLGTPRGTAGKDLLDLSRLSWMDFGLRTPRQGLSNEAKALDQEWENSSRQKVWKIGMCLCWVLLLKAAGAGLLSPILLPLRCSASHWDLSAPFPHTWNRTSPSRLNPGPAFHWELPQGQPSQG